MNKETDDEHLLHVIVAHPEFSNEEISQHVADEFCKAYARQFGVATSVTETETQDVDAIIDIDGVAVALELVSYRQRDDFIEDENADCNAQREISKAFTAAGLPPIEVRIEWNTEKRRKVQLGASAHRSMVPRGRTLQDFIAELVQLAKYVLDNQDLAKQHLAFCQQPERSNRHAPTGGAFVDSSQYEFLAKYCDSVVLEEWKHPGQPAIRTSANVRHVGVDSEFLREKITSKLRKLDRYRNGVNGKQVWLVIHSDGNPLSTRVPASIRSDILGVIREVLDVSSESFDKVWWAENTGYSDSTKLFEIRRPLKSPETDETPYVVLVFRLVCIALVIGAASFILWALVNTF